MTGWCPPWYVVVSAARYLRVSPWTLERQPIRWVVRAHLAAKAEANARAALDKMGRG